MSASTAAHLGAAVSPTTEAAIIAECEASGSLFEDPHFQPPPNQRWLRPSQIFAETSLFAGGSTAPAALKMGSGRLGDGWLLGALAALAVRPAQLHRLFVSARGQKFGVYSLQLFVADAWVLLTIDNRLPCDALGVPLYTQSGRVGELWVPLVEKAWAKLLGSYDALHTGCLAHALRALTGGVPLSLRLSPPAGEDAATEAGSGTAATSLGWDRFVRLVASGSPVALYHNADDEAGAEVDEPVELTPGERGEMLAGLAYPVLRTRVRGLPSNP